MQAHILAHFIDEPKPEFPFLCLTVSGGHTQLVLVKSPIDFELLGQTRDDAAGEAFDKIGKLLGLPYPAGPVLDKLAKTGDARRFDFPEPQIPGLDFSFSGLKTSVLHFLQRETQKDSAFIENNLADLCAAVQDRIVSILINKLRKAANEQGIRQLAIAGGVSANSGLREAMQQLQEKEGYVCFIPDFAYCTDNAGMVAMAGYLRTGLVDYDDQTLVPNARLALTDS
jgi:N6-L-threonylcarbamoyladenine synthase